MKWKEGFSKVFWGKVFLSEKQLIHLQKQFFKILKMQKTQRLGAGCRIYNSHFEDVLPSRNLF